jgi:hypothetical protein
MMVPVSVVGFDNSITRSLKHTQTCSADAVMRVVPLLASLKGDRNRAPETSQRDSSCGGIKANFVARTWPGWAFSTSVQPGAWVVPRMPAMKGPVKETNYLSGPLQVSLSIDGGLGLCLPVGHASIATGTVSTGGNGSCGFDGMARPLHSRWPRGHRGGGDTGTRGQHARVQGAWECKVEIGGYGVHGPSTILCTQALLTGKWCGTVRRPAGAGNQAQAKLWLTEGLLASRPGNV